jgi:mono/diheme cytochrome c family protein
MPGASSSHELFIPSLPPAELHPTAGAGTYPSLAGDRNLEARGYPTEVVVNGQRGMPPFGSMMSNDQVAAVVNYLRTHFDNGRDEVTADDAKAVRR